MISYDIHWNYDDPFKVEVDPDKIIVRDNEIPIIAFENYKEVLIGTGAYNNNTNAPDGNTILVNTKDLEYIFVGNKILKFKALSKIVKYISNIGNNDVPYPYAIDTKGRYYLMIENVILTNYTGIDPYTWYYAERQISVLATGKRLYKNSHLDIYCMYDGENQYSMSYDSFPREPNVQYSLQFHNENSEIIRISFEDYKEILEQFGASKGFVPLVMTLL